MPPHSNEFNTSQASKQALATFPGLKNWKFPMAQSSSAFMSYPPEVRYMIPTTCIKPTWVQPETGTDEFDDESNALWGWYLSLIMPPPLF